ncbi:hypothetical protein POJ06DRAFT_264380 [Lipomyces tetrasporus]|uniref:Uncharacterized protein n=1 Tax=Lipomyces tetrasporus TaxID=54092 RepID=A0AAD7VW19_9ASCO|nr:uncharacterized protein POJ06DRAFT_264380 [Lipomyces tetrasporus]KAJ8103554.1 hypothetical protein POJ06DRAFT_264380 [Lipomyces tetrasporus]
MAHTLGLPESVAKKDHSGAVTSTWSTSTLPSPASGTSGSDQNDSPPLVSEIQSHHNPVDSANVISVKGFLSFERVVHRRRFFSSLESLRLVSHTAEFVLAFLCMFPGGRKGLEHDDIRNEEDEEKASTTLPHLDISLLLAQSWNDF